MSVQDNERINQLLNERGFERCAGFEYDENPDFTHLYIDVTHHSDDYFCLCSDGSWSHEDCYGDVITNSQEKGSGELNLIAYLKLI